MVQAVLTAGRRGYVSEGDGFGGGVVVGPAGGEQPADDAELATWVPKVQGAQLDAGVLGWSKPAEWKRYRPMAVAASEAMPAIS
jgi:hypothetical protein